MARQLTKEEEAAAGSEDMEVRREDQEKINKFSSLHQKETLLEEELRSKIVSTPPSCSQLHLRGGIVSTVTENRGPSLQFTQTNKTPTCCVASANSK